MKHYATSLRLSQQESCDNHRCEDRKSCVNGSMSARSEADMVFSRLDRLGLSQRALAERLGIEENKLSKVKAGTRRFQARELIAALEWLDTMEAGQYRPDADLPETDDVIDYVPVDVLPTYAGMGGGGTGDGDREIALIPRILIEDMLRGRASDFVVINVRGDSMEPDFYQGDQLLVDKRDISPAQPGPFAVWDGEWGEYVVKNVERLVEGRVRMFSTNPKYSPVDVTYEETRIIGRPVWFGRRL